MLTFLEPIQRDISWQLEIMFLQLLTHVSIAILFLSMCYLGHYRGHDLSIKCIKHLEDEKAWYSGSYCSQTLFRGTRRNLVLLSDLTTTVTSYPCNKHEQITDRSLILLSILENDIHNTSKEIEC